MESKNNNICGNEDEIYKIVPNDINEKNNYAHVTLIIINNEKNNIAPAIVLAHSLRKVETKAELIALVTFIESVNSDHIMKLLRMFYDHVKIVSPIKIENWRNKKNPNKKNLNYAFTKFHLFNLTEYKKILYHDTDTIVIKYPDHLFSLKTPAGTLIPKNNDLKIKTSKYYKYCVHNEIIPKAITDKVETNIHNSGIGNKLLLLEPNVNELDNIIEQVTKNEKMNELVKNMFIWPDQQYLTLRYSGKWTAINPKFYGLYYDESDKFNSDKYNKLINIQYDEDKPYMLESKHEISYRVEQDDFIIWHKYFREILLTYPELNDNNYLKEALDVHKFTQAKLHRIMPANNKVTSLDTIDKISNKYNISKGKIHMEQIKYYYLNQIIQFRPIDNIFPMFQVERYDYIEPIKRLGEFYHKSNSNYYTILYNKIKDIKFDTKPLNRNTNFTNKLDEVELDEIMLQYVKCNKNIFVITLWPLSNAVTESFIQVVKDYGDIYYIKKINITKKLLKNIMFMMYDDFVFSERMRFITNKSDYMDKFNIESMTIIIFGNINNEKISGQASEFKQFLRNKLDEILKKKNDGIQKHWISDLIHVNDYFYQTIEYCQILLNKNSLEMLEYQNIDNLIKLNQGFLKFQVLRKWAYENMSLLNLNRICLTSGALFYSLGLRNISNIDGIVASIEPIYKKSDNYKISQEETEFQQLVNTNLQQKETKIPFFDINIEHSDHWKEALETRNIDIFNKFNISNFSEIAFNPKYHWYSNGFKMYLFDYDIVRKISRIFFSNDIHHLSSDISDLVYLYFKERHLLKNYVMMNRETNKMLFNGSQIEKGKITDELLESIFNKILLKYNNSTISLTVLKEIL
jgi:glycogenin glucosyltransferase